MFVSNLPDEVDAETRDSATLPMSGHVRSAISEPLQEQGHGVRSSVDGGVNQSRGFCDSKGPDVTMWQEDVQLAQCAQREQLVTRDQKRFVALDEERVKLVSELDESAEVET